MPFIAGAIVGPLLLDTSKFSSGLTLAVAAATAACAAIASAVKGAADEFDSMGEKAEAVGVSTQFLSGVGAAATDAGSSVEGLGNALKFINKNAADAAGGGKAAVDAFNAIGISQSEVQANLGDTEGMFRLIVDGINQLPTAAQKTEAAMSLLGKSGNELVPLINQGTEGIDQYAQMAERLGATVSDAAAEGGNAFSSLGSMVDLAWKGIRNAVAEPILAAISENSEGLEQTIIKISDLVREAIPPALNIIGGIIEFILDGADSLLAVIEQIANVSDALGITTDAGGAVRTGREAVQTVREVVSDVRVNVNASFDGEQSSSQIAQKLAPDLRNLALTQTKNLEGSARRALVAGSVGGRAS